MRPTTVLVALLLAAACVHPAAAEETKRLGKFGAWESFAYTDGGNKMCYAAAAAASLQGGEKGKNGTKVLVTHRMAAKSLNEVSVSADYSFKKDSDVELQVGGKKFTLFTRGDHAWAKDAAADKTLVEAMRKAKDAGLRATPGKGTAISGSLPLSGFGDALAAIDKACGVKR